MNILVAKNGSQLGPFSESDIRAKLSSGEFSPSDFGWHEGLTAWSPLSQLVGDAPSGSPAPPAPSPSLAPQPSYAPASPQPQPYAPPQGQGAPGGYAPQPYNSPYPQPYQQGGAPWGAQGAGNYAGFWLRFVAYIIDAIILAIPTFIIVYLLLAASSGLDAQAATFISRAVNILLAWGYYAYMESSASQATLGKMALGLKVTDENGSRIGFGQATGRYWGMIVSALIVCVGFMMVGWTQRKQGLHDILAHTLVVKK